MADFDFTVPFEFYQYIVSHFLFDDERCVDSICTIIDKDGNNTIRYHAYKIVHEEQRHIFEVV